IAGDCLSRRRLRFPEPETRTPIIENKIGTRQRPFEGRLERFLYQDFWVPPPLRGGRWRATRAGGGGTFGSTPTSQAPSTMLRMVPLPRFAGRGAVYSL